MFSSTLPTPVLYNETCVLWVWWSNVAEFALALFMVCGLIPIIFELNPKTHYILATRTVVGRFLLEMACHRRAGNFLLGRGGGGRDGKNRCPSIYETVEKKPGSYDALTKAYKWGEKILTNDSIILYELIKRLCHFDSRRCPWYDPCHCWLKSWRVLSFNVNKCDVTNALLPHGVAEINFQSARRTEWSFCRTRCSRYHFKDMCHIKKVLETYQIGNSRTLSPVFLKQSYSLIRAHDENSRTLFCSASRLSPSIL